MTFNNSFIVCNRNSTEHQQTSEETFTADGQQGNDGLSTLYASLINFAVTIVLGAHFQNRRLRDSQH